MSQDPVHGRGIRRYPSRIMEEKRLAITGGVVERVHRVAAPEGEGKLATDRHAIGFTFILPTRHDDVFYCAERIWSGRTAGARFAITPANGETTTELTGVGAEKYLVLFLAPGSMLRAASGEHGAGGALTPFWGELLP